MGKYNTLRNPTPEDFSPKEKNLDRIWSWYTSLDRFTRYTFTSILLIFLIGITTAGIIFEFRSNASTIISTQLIDNFDQDTTSVSSWALTEWPTGPTGTLTLGQGYNYTNNPNDKAANINFTFQASASGNQEVDFSTNFATPPPQAEELGFMVKSPAGVKINLFVYDNSGQRLEYDTERPFEATNPNNWYQDVIKLDEPQHYTGGANNGAIQLPIKRISILVKALIGDHNDSNNAFVGSGTVAIDNVAWMDTNTTTATRTVNPQDPAIVLPSTAADNVLNTIGLEPQGSGVTTFMLNSLQQAGVKWARRDLLWSNVEKSYTSPPTYNWSSSDSIVSSFKNIGVKTLFILDYGNPLYMYYQTSTGQDYGDTASNALPTAPLSPVSAYINFVKAAAAHYNQLYPGWFAFEIWNEPAAVGFWYPTPNASQYATLESGTVAAIQSVSPTIPITTAGFADDWNYLHSYMSSMQSLGGDHANAIAFHPYREDIPETISDGVLYIRSVLQQQAWITEWGYPTDATWWNFGATQPNTYIGSQANNVSVLQAKMVVRQLWTTVALGIQHMDYYKLQDSSLLFGLWDAAGNPKPSWSAFTTATKYMQQFTHFVGIEPMQLTNLHTLVFQNSNQYLLVLWKDGSGSQVLDTIPSTYSIQSETDYMGNSISVSGNAIWVNDTPVYVVVNNPTASTPTPTTALAPTATPTPMPISTPTPTVVDTAPPTVSITSPTTGTVARHSTVTITASASDDTKVTQVTFLVNGQVICTDTVLPYTCAWNVSGKPGATYTLTAQATDVANYYTISNPVIISSH